jgi:hypothetical protein
VSELTGRPLKVLAGLELEETSIIMTDDDEQSPENGAIPVYRQGGPRDGDLMAYVSILPALDGSAHFLVHGPDPHPEPVQGCAACADLLGLK